MNPFNLLKPEYLCRPLNAWNRLFRRRPGPVELVTLPWGLPLRVRTDETIGRQIWTLGVFELVESEVLWRLTQPGDRCVDVGANIGYTSSLLACRAGVTGSVDAYEPHPDLFVDGVANAGLWCGYGAARVEYQQVAISQKAGKATLRVPGGFTGNNGLSTLEGDGAGIEVTSDTLDSRIGGDRGVGILKVDVEGHEYSVLAGAADSLERGMVRDIVYEDHRAYPSHAALALRSANYSVFRLDYSWWKPVLGDPERAPAKKRPLETPNFLATLDPGRAIARMKPSGWNCLSAAPLLRK